MNEWMNEVRVINASVTTAAAVTPSMLRRHHSSPDGRAAMSSDAEKPEVVGRKDLANNVNSLLSEASHSDSVYRCGNL